MSEANDTAEEAPARGKRTPRTKPRRNYVEELARSEGRARLSLKMLGEAIGCFDEDPGVAKRILSIVAKTLKGE